jgi:type III secretory pathway lipoprotein EscJ
MKGYDNLPKSLKKHGLDATKVTDDAGNTWWEVDVPARLGEGVGEIRAYNKGGQVSNKIRVLKKEGYPQKQAVAIALAMKQEGRL